MSPTDEIVAARGTQTAKKALALLRLIVKTEGGASISQLTRETGVRRSTAYRLLKLLEEEGLARREPISARYGVGPSMVALAASVLGNLSARDVARPVLESVAAFTSETVLLYVRNELFRVCVDGIEGEHIVRRTIQLGRTVPIYEGATGIAMMTVLDAADRATILRAATTAGRNASTLEKEIAVASRCGYASQYKRSPAGISMPVLLPAGQVAAVTVSGPIERCNPRTMNKLAPLMIEVVRRFTTGIEGTEEVRQTT